VPAAYSSSSRCLRQQYQCLGDANEAHKQGLSITGWRQHLAAMHPAYLKLHRPSHLMLLTTRQNQCQ
jgi:hypothetical protein